MDISLRKVAHIILRARELETKVGRWDSPGDVADSDTILESRASDATGQELRSFIGTLNGDEQADLTAIAWIGRGSFTADEFDEARQTAADEATTPTADYLMGMPLLSDYLEDGLSEMGIDIADIEDGLLAHK